MLEEKGNLKAALLASGVMAFAGLGDAVLYPVLPVYAASLNIPVFGIGVLLSANRFVRIIGNTWVANLVRHFGIKKVLMLSGLLGVITTSIYGLSIGLWSMLVARIVWGLAYSGMKTSTLGIAAQFKSGRGLAFGATQSLKSLAVLFAFMLGPWLVVQFGIGMAFLVLAVCSLPAVVFSLFTPAVQVGSNRIEFRKTFAPTPINLLVFVLACTIDGILIVGLAHLLSVSIHETSDLIVTAASYMLLSRLFMIGVSLLSGFVSMRISPAIMFNFSVWCCLLGLFLIAIGFVVEGIVFCFFFNTVVVCFAPLVAMRSTQNQLLTVSQVSSWWDLGAGVGAFVGIGLLNSIGQHYLFMIVSVVSALIFLNYKFRYENSN
ncbi:MFS transporter [Reichenbachiella sp.]|uniref:MFS transporter n=1 Tax=Reichenbachiella sp. TaxID=2184521 RepID=UPI003BB1C598